jgi:hypothetical protein
MHNDGFELKESHNRHNVFSARGKTCDDNACIECEFSFHYVFRNLVFLLSLRSPVIVRNQDNYNNSVISRWTDQDHVVSP